jgi:hypothetical protein
MKIKNVRMNIREPKAIMHDMQIFRKRQNEAKRKKKAERQNRKKGRNTCK